MSDEVGQDKGTRRLWAAFAISVLQPSLGCAVSSVPDSRFYRLCSRCPGGKKISGLYVVKLFTYSPGLSCEGTPGFIMRLPFSPSIKIRFILQDPFKCCFQPLSSNCHRPLSVLAKSVCRSYPNRPCSFLRTFPFLIRSFDLHLLRICPMPGTLLGTEDTAAYKTDKNLCVIVPSEISQRKTNTVPYHLHVESKKYYKLVK